MHLTRETLDTWAAALRARLAHPGPASGYTRLIRLEDGDSIVATTGTISGPAIVELVVYRDGGWSAREQVYETPESIALAASLAQRFPNSNTYEE